MILNIENPFKKLRVRLFELKISQISLAKSTGIHPTHVSEILNGIRIPNETQVESIFKALDEMKVEYSDIFEGQK